MTSQPSSVFAPRTEESLAEYRNRIQSIIPPVLYLPTLPSDSPFQEVLLFQNGEGESFLLAYTALDRLADCCGADQSWLLYETAKLHELAQSLPYKAIYLDLPIPPQYQTGAQQKEAVL